MLQLSSAPQSLPSLASQTACAAAGGASAASAVFPVTKDRPILFSALATADVLLTLDRVDFGRLLGGRFYGLAIMTPGAWLLHERGVGGPGVW